MACCPRLAPALLLHVNLLLCMLAGAGLSGAARLKWDPSTYVAVRALLPLECGAAAGALCAASVALLALAQLAAVALAVRAARPRLATCLLYTYGGCMAALCGAEAGCAAWAAARLARWLRSARAAPLLRLLELRDHVRPLLAFLARYHPLPDHINQLIQEASEDAPRYAQAAAAALLLAALLQAAAALLALLCAAHTARARAAPPRQHHDSISYSVVSTENEKAPLRTAYRNGRIVIV